MTLLNIMFKIKKYAREIDLSTLRNLLANNKDCWVPLTETIYLKIVGYLSKVLFILKYTLI